MTNDVIPDDTNKNVVKYSPILQGIADATAYATRTQSFVVR